MDLFLQRNTQARGPSPRAEVGSTSLPSRAEPPAAKRLKVDEEAQDDYNTDQKLSDEEPDTSGFGADDDHFNNDDEGAASGTAIETALPVIKTDSEAIEEYEFMRASQASEPDAAASPLDRRKWVRGKSSIYVDAFTLALDTVLEDEAHLFDERELALFEQWRVLSYEAQFLYVRLFLRKTASWHRINRLGYYNDISDPETAVTSLQETRKLPQGLPSSQPELIEGIPLEDFALGDEFTFADSSERDITTIEEAASLLNLDELKSVAKDAKVQGKNKGDLFKALCRSSHQQAGLDTLGITRTASRGSSEEESDRDYKPPSLKRQQSSREQHFLEKVLAMTGPCIRLSSTPFKLFERVHLVFYRSTEWTEKSLTTIILAKIARRNFPDYIVCRTSNIFTTRAHLLEFEAAIRVELEVDKILEFGGPLGPDGFQKVVDIFETIYPRWVKLLKEEQIKEDRVYESGEGGYLRRFSPVHPYTRIVHKAAYVFGRLKEHKREHSLVSQLLDQHLFHHARRGGWYQRKALLEEHYMYAADPKPVSADQEQQKKHWKRMAVKTCEVGLQDNDCHIIYHRDLQKRLLKLEKQLRIPRRLQHDFGHVRLVEPMEHTVEGIQIKKDELVGKLGRAPSTKTVWVDEREGGGECSVEDMCLSWYRSQGWKGYHSEGGIVRTLFAYLFYDILFIFIPNVFQTAFQTCPLDLHTDSFYPTRASEINRRLAEITNGEAERIVREVDARERERRTCVVGLNWDFELDDVVELVSCFRGEALASVCKVMAQEYRQRGGGVPDLVLWRTEPRRECMFSEVKSANDRLSDTQRLWVHVLTGAGVPVALCNAVAKEVRAG